MGILMDNILKKKQKEELEYLMCVDFPERFSNALLENEKRKQNLE